MPQIIATAKFLATVLATPATVPPTPLAITEITVRSEQPAEWRVALSVGVVNTWHPLHSLVIPPPRCQVGLGAAVRGTALAGTAIRRRPLSVSRPVESAIVPAQAGGLVAEVGRGARAVHPDDVLGLGRWSAQGGVGRRGEQEQ
jgi:hypothetical protein